MKFKLLVVLVADKQTDLVVSTAREAGATGCTVLPNARGEGLKPPSTFFGLSLEGQRDMVLLLVEEHLSRQVLEHVASVCQFEEKPGVGIAFQLDIEDVIGMGGQIATIQSEIEDEL